MKVLIKILLKQATMWTQLLNEISAYIYSNENEEISGNLLQGVLHFMTERLGYVQFRGVANPQTGPLTPDEGTYYWIARENGVYTLWGNLEIYNEVAIFKKTAGESWQKFTIFKKEEISLGNLEINENDIEDRNSSAFLRIQPLGLFQGTAFTFDLSSFTVNAQGAKIINTQIEDMPDRSRIYRDGAASGNQIFLLDNSQTLIRGGVIVEASPSDGFFNVETTWASFDVNYFGMVGYLEVEAGEMNFSPLEHVQFACDVKITGGGKLETGQIEASSLIEGHGGIRGQFISSLNNSGVAGTIVVHDTDVGAPAELVFEDGILIALNY